MNFIDRLNRYYVLAAGLLIAALMVLIVFLVAVRPALAEQKKLNVNAAKEQTVANRHVARQRDLNKAEERLTVLKAAYERMRGGRNPFIPVGDEDDTLFEYVWPELRHQTGPVMRDWFQSHGYPFRGVESMPNSGTAGIPPDTNAIEIGLGRLTMTLPNFPSILEFLPRLKNTPRITEMHDELTIMGPSPGLTLQWGMQLYLLTQAPPQGVGGPGGPAGAQAGERTQGSGGGGTDGGQARGGESAPPRPGMRGGGR